MTELESGQAVEIGVVGNEGMTSVMGFLGGQISIDSMVCQVAGSAARMPIDVFRATALEAHACKCYRLTRKQVKTIMGIDIG